MRDGEHITTRKARPRGGLSLLALVVATCAVGSLGLAVGPTVAALSVVDTPNQGRPPRCDEPAPAGASREIWVEVEGPRAQIHAWVFEPASDPIGTVLVLHGIEARGSMMDGTARSYAEAGLRAVAVDLRGHGCSTGEWATYGVVDARDLSALLDALPDDGPVGVHGFSYGGGAALQLAARDPRVAAVVTLATFSSLDELVADQARRRVGAAWPLLPDAVVRGTIEATGHLAGFDPDEARSDAALAHSGVPTLVVHGTADDIVPVRHAFALADAAPDHSRLLILPGEDHDSVAEDADGSIRRAATEWLVHWLGGDSAGRAPAVAAVDAAVPQA